MDSDIEDGFIGDAMKLQQILVNLLGNAVKFTPEHGKNSLAVNLVSLDQKYARIQFHVNDTGCGIKKEAQSRIFEAFEQQDSSTTSEYGGTGLGLAISKNLTSLMGGEIRLRSIVEIGTEFIVDVSLELDPDQRIKRKITYVFDDLKALVVDDDALVCENTVKTLREIGMTAERVASGGEAVDLVKQRWSRQKSFDYILVDWKMPEMDGIETSPTDSKDCRSGRYHHYYDGV